MQKRKLGNSGIEVAPLAFGGNVFGWTVDEPASCSLLDAFVAADLNLIDSADVYSTWVAGHTGGESENIIGKWLKKSGRRDKVVIATKVGMEMAADKKGLTRAYILRAAEVSLRRLHTDSSHLYQSHTRDPDTPIEETVEAYAQLIQAGKVRAVGASIYSVAQLRRSVTASNSFTRFCIIEKGDRAVPANAAGKKIGHKHRARFNH